MRSLLRGGTRSILTIRSNRKAAGHRRLKIPKKTGYEAAVRVAVDKLQTVDLHQRCVILGLEQPKNKTLNLRAFGSDLVLRLSDYQLFPADSNEPVKVSDRILALHYLLCKVSIPEPGELISFRQLDSGMFYLPAFLSRSVKPLVACIGNDLELLKKNLHRFDWEPVNLGDFAARIHALGKVYTTLIYRLGDDEFPPSADLLFDESIKRVFCTEDTAVLASRICLSLL